MSIANTKNPKEMTREELDALPEYPLFGEEEVNGLPGQEGKLYRPVLNQLPVQSMDGDTIIRFVDSRGQCWTPVWDGHRWCKRAVT